MDHVKINKIGEIPNKLEIMENLEAFSNFIFVILFIYFIVFILIIYFLYDHVLFVPHFHNRNTIIEKSKTKNHVFVKPT